MKPDIPTLVSKMKDHPSTCGWDAMCSYDGDTLNGILAAQFKDLHQISTIVMGTPEDPYRTGFTTFNVPHMAKGLTMTQVNYKFGLDLPRLQFSNSDARAVLAMPITAAAQSGFAYTLTYASEADQAAGAALKENTWYIRDKASQQFYQKTPQEVLAECWDEVKKAAKEPFPANYYYRASRADIIPEFDRKVYVLSSIDLAFASSGGKASDPLQGTSYVLQARVPLASVAGNQVVPAGTIVTFDASKGKTEGQVILNFDITSGTGADFALLDAHGGAGVPTILKDAPSLLEDLKVYFSKALTEIQLRLAGVAVGAETPSQIPVKPRAFLFWSTQIGETSILSIFLNIDGSATQNPAGQPSFQYNDGTTGLPIPQGYTGSLILSRDYLARNYFPRAFTRAGFNQMNPAGDTLSPIAFSGNYHRPTTIQGKRIDVALSFIGVIGGFEYADFGTVHIDDYYFGFTFRSDDVLNISASQVARIDIPVYLHYHVRTGKYSFTRMTETKNAQVTLKIDKSVSLSGSQPREDGFSLTFSVSKTDYSASSTSNIQGICDDHTQRDVESKVRDEIGNIAPDITVQLPELRTLALENMLFNGATRFHLSPEAKMHFPHDLLLVGKLQ
jgi:hypothetical protein